ncbi:hypothetical protein M9H77_22880 [Catharanthus roseus]|uniref:Uncharacterized protein n=1 Tax=Catharanthus roseus TaxID=4058 RepID=A0ACC0AU94_CATRO|nr:hypothetical protein M9H77_22880 [Catharanthus roseus]
MFDRYPNLNPPIHQHNTTELQIEIRSLKAQVKELKERVFSVETKNLELDTQIALLQSRTSKGNEILLDSSIPDFPFAEIPMPGTSPQDSKFISIIDKITFQKWNIYVTISIGNFKATFTAINIYSYARQRSRSKLHQRWINSYKILRTYKRIISYCKRYASTGQR